MPEEKEGELMNDRITDEQSITLRKAEQAYSSVRYLCNPATEEVVSKWPTDPANNDHMGRGRFVGCAE